MAAGGRNGDRRGRGAQYAAIVQRNGAGFHLVNHDRSVNVLLTCVYFSLRNR